MFLLPCRCLLMMAFQDSSVIDVFTLLTGWIFSERLVVHQTFFFLNITSHHLFGIQHILRWNVSSLHQVDHTVIVCVNISHNTLQPTQSLFISCTDREDSIQEIEITYPYGIKLLTVQAKFQWSAVSQIMVYIQVSFYARVVPEKIRTNRHRIPSKTMYILGGGVRGLTHPT